MSFGVSQASGLQGLPSAYLTVDKSNSIITASAVLDDDFVGNVLDSNKWKTSDSDTGTLTLSSTGAGCGILVLNTTAVINKTCVLNSTNTPFNPIYQKKLDAIFEGIFASSTSDIIIRAGIYKDANNYSVWEVDTATRGNSNWWSVTNNAGSNTAYDSTIALAVTSSTRQHLRLNITSTSANEMNFYLANPGSSVAVPSYSLIKTHTSAETNSTGNWMPYLYLKTLNAAGRQINIDRIRISQARGNI